MTFDRGMSIGLFVFSGWVFYLSVTMPKSAMPQFIGPEVEPTGISIGLMLASIALFLSTMRPSSARTKSSSPPEGVNREDHRTQGLVVSGGVAFMFLLQPLGFIVATSLFCMYETAVFEAGHWVRNAVVAVAFSVGVYALFVNFLEVQLPVGLLGW